MTNVSPLNTAPLPVRLRIEDYLLLHEAGAFASYNRTELIDGGVYFVNAQHRPHALAKIELYDAIRDALRSIQSPLRPMVEASIALSPHDVPEPDIVLTSEPRGEGLVPLDSVHLVIEVSDTTMRSDIRRKVASYARAAMPEYWVVDVKARTIHQMWAPCQDIYTQRRAVVFGDPIIAVTVAGLRVDTASL
ncbi:Uma2 family endonuclease [Sphingomonas glacialis]|uniref:Uma2 family endonuclease n=1 Tax=Sphingomonas glacialis TaxID=658225 RepID=A0A502FX20_9SPHN|nr:Uma2 family endonuclease [Sphingomonas glacialis]TPG54177.1 Uma2 family endonuclease [Sphingomonas glacialis]